MGLSPILIVILSLYVIRHIFHIITELVSDHVGIVVCYNTILSLAMIASLGCILKGKKWGVYGAFAINIINPFGQALLGSADFIPSFFISLLAIGMISLFLLIRNDGESAWHFLFKHDDSLNGK